MGGYATKGGLSKDSPASHVKELGFPACHFVIHVVNDVLEIIIDKSYIEDGKT